MSTPRVLSVGQCGLDGGRLIRLLRDTFHAQVLSADTQDEALAALQSERFELILVNRIFDLDGSSGFDLIRAIKADDSLADTPTILVSNYPESQAEAVALGALPGFGKADLGKEKARDALRRVFKLAEAR
jgi:two-component system chemotaxis response regulator CheY